MKPKEFYEIMERFVEEEKRWRALKLGDTIYDEVPRFGDIDYHEAEINFIDVNERYVLAYDRANSINPNNVIKLTAFLTQNEFNEIIK